MRLISRIQGIPLTVLLLAVFCLALAYASTLVPPDPEPSPLADNCLALFIMLCHEKALALTSVSAVVQGEPSSRDQPAGRESGLARTDS